MEEGLSDRKYYNNEEIYEEKEVEYLDDTSPEEMEEGVSDLKMTRMKKMMREKRLNA